MYQYQKELEAWSCIDALAVHQTASIYGRLCGIENRKCPYAILETHNIKSLQDPEVIKCSYKKTVLEGLEDEWFL
ncbi:MAG: hypothetical protein Q7R52_02555 [archaeon]|nr:hypothetical protein [archaeon]